MSYPERNILDSPTDCLALAMGELRIALQEAVEPLADLASLLLRARRWRRRTLKTWPPK
jgi:hypothetical protein